MEELKKKKLLVEYHENNKNIISILKNNLPENKNFCNNLENRQKEIIKELTNLILIQSKFWIW